MVTRFSIIFFFVIFIYPNLSDSQPIGIEKIQTNGSNDKFINIVILGDGYTQSQQTKFINDCKSFSNYLFSIEPFKQYKNYFNIVAIKVISVDSGARHDHSAPDCPGIASHPILMPNTYFQCRFDVGGIHRLIVPGDFTNISKALVQYFPFYDQVVILSNTPYYGGSGGTFATSTLHGSSNEITVHELGHSFASLSDEYYAGNQYARESINMSMITDRNINKWKNWLDFKNVGIYQHCCGGNSSQWYKPHQGCKMQALGLPFCSVCVEGIIEQIHNLMSPLIKYTPEDLVISISDSNLTFKLDELVKPEPNSLYVKWIYDNNEISYQQDSLILLSKDIPSGSSFLSLSIEDTSTMLRVNNHKNIHLTYVEWEIQKSISSINITSYSDQFEIEIYPNPTQDDMNLEIQSEKNYSLELNITNSEGKILQNFNIKKLQNKFQQKFSIKDLVPGIYFAQLINSTNKVKVKVIEFVKE